MTKQAPKTPTGFTLPRPLESGWKEVITSTFHRKKGDKRQLTANRIVDINQEDLRTLWMSYTKERNSLPKYLMDPKQLAYCYLLGFHLPNCARLLSMLNRLQSYFSMDDLTNLQELEIFDLGCGTGAMSSTLLSQIKEHERTTVHLLDFRDAFLNLSKKMVAQIAPNSQVITRKLRLGNGRFAQVSPKSQKISVVLMGYIWNELNQHPKNALSVIRTLEEFAKGPAVLMIMDPANSHLSRQVMELRDKLLSADYVPVYPCPDTSPCPMLRRSKDWCFSEDYWNKNQIVSKIDKILGVNRHKLSFTGMTFVSRSLFQSLNIASQASPTVVGKPIHHSKPCFLLCNGSTLSRKPQTEPLNRGEKLIESNSSPKTR